MSRHTLDVPTEPLDDSRPGDVNAPEKDLPDFSSVLNRHKESAPEPEPDTSAVDETWIAQAKELGFSDDELEGADQATLERLVRAVDKRTVEFLSRFQQPNPAQQAGMGAGVAGNQPPAAPPTPQLPNQFTIDLDTDEYDPALVKTLKSMNEYWAQQFQALNQSLQAAQQPTTVADDPTTRWFDAQFSGLGEDYVSVFGKGKIDDLRPDSAEEKSRVELFRTFDALRQAYPNATDEVLFQRALNASFGHIKEQQKAKQLKAAATRRKQTTIGKPSGRQAANIERDPFTGLSTTTIDAVQRAIDSKLNR